MGFVSILEHFGTQCYTILLGRWRQSDIPIKRFRCVKENSFTKLLPHGEEDEFYRDTPIFTCKFAPQESNEHLVALANEDGKLAIHDCETGSRYGVQAHNNAIFDLAWMFDQMKLVTASGDHTSTLYDIGNGEIRNIRVFCGHNRSVKTVAFRKDDCNVFATGGRDGDIIIWDIRCNLREFVGKADRVISNSHFSKTYTPSKSKKKFSTPTQSGIKSVTGLVFQEDNTLISCGAGDGVIKIWDLRKNYVTYKKEAVPKSIIPYSGNTTKNGYSSLLLDNSCTKLYANCLDNTIYCYNVGTYNPEPIMKYTGYQNSTFYVKSALCKNGDFLISGSSDENAYIWNTKFEYPLVKLTGHTAEVTCVAWCNKKDYLITCSDDMTHMIWTIGPEELSENWEITGRGKAEVLPIKHFMSNPKLKRELQETYSDSKKQVNECGRCSAATIFKICENCLVSTKRKCPDNTDLKNTFLTEFEPKRLFAHSSQSSSSEKTEALAKYLDENDDPFNLLEECEPPRKIPKISEIPHSKYSSMFTELIKNSLDTIDFKTKKNAAIDCEDSEPQCKMAKLEITPKKNKHEDILSPTLNLPNYIVDGIAPHIHYSPPKKKCQDWLTKLRIEKLLRQEMCNRTDDQSSPKQLKSEVTPKKPKHLSPRSPLLKYFRITNNSPKCDGLICAKSHSSNMHSAHWNHTDH